MEAMERVLPAGVQVTSIEPIRAPDGHITVHVRVVGPRDKADDLVANLEQSRRFLQPRITGENAESSNNPLQRQDPPHMDYPDDVKYEVSCREAVRREIRIDTVQCGDVAETRRVWKDIARRAEGSYVALAQSGNMVAVTTPFDDDIARASAEIGGTMFPTGSGNARRRHRGKVARPPRLPPPSWPTAPPSTWRRAARRSRARETWLPTSSTAGWTWRS